MRKAWNRKAIEANRQNQIMELTMQGRTTREIARVIGLSQSQTWQLYDRAISEMHGETAKLAEREREYQLQLTERAVERRTDLLFDPSVQIIGTDAGGKTFEMRDFEMVNKTGGTLVKVLERRAKLTGADMPAKVHAG